MVTFPQVVAVANSYQAPTGRPLTTSSDGALCCQVPLIASKCNEVKVTLNILIVGVLTLNVVAVFYGFMTSRNKMCRTTP